ncbi:MFS transporter [Actinoplanes sp. DH11]|uniref:MFS transporter n=1 Tax=Actinoplanes sp. DH11 TaxID=2857011 RepID=UPI001E4067D5|nr:MFS transporter [Actinoplanes sp. DH11]
MRGDTQPVGQRLAFSLLRVATTVDTLGMSVAVVALPMAAVTVLGADAGQVSVLAAAVWLPALLFGLPAGAAADRLAPRTLMRVADGALALLLSAVAFAAWLGSLTLPLLVGTAFVAGGLAVVAAAAYRTVLPAVVPFERLPMATARLQGSEWTARVIGAAVAGVVTQVAGAAGGLLICAAAAMIAVTAVSLMRPAYGTARPATGAKERPGGPAAGLRLLIADPLLRAVTVFGAGSALGRAMVQAVQVAYLLLQVQLSTAATGLLLSVAGVGGILGALLSPRLGRRLGTARALVLVQLAGVPLMALMPLAGSAASTPLFAVGALAGGFTLVAGNVTVAGFRLTYCPPEMLGRVSAGMMTLTYGAMPLGALMAAAVSALGDARAALGAGVAVQFLAAAGLAAGPLRGRRDFPVRQPAAV